MRRLLLLVPVLAGSLASATAVEGVAGLSGLSVTLDALGYASSEFDVGYRSEKWSSGSRYELNIFAQVEPGRVSPGGGMYIFYEQHEWDGQQFLGTKEHADLDCWGFGLQGGATLHLIEPNKPLMLALVPYLRGGLGFQDFTATNVVIDGARYDMSADSGRIEVAAGIDLRVVVAGRLEAVFGGGVDYWSGADVALYAGTGGGGVAVGSNGNFTGTDAWVRFGLGLHF